MSDWWFQGDLITTWSVYKKEKTGEGECGSEIIKVIIRKKTEEWNNYFVSLFREKWTRKTPRDSGVLWQYAMMEIRSNYKKIGELKVDITEDLLSGVF